MESRPAVKANEGDLLYPLTRFCNGDPRPLPTYEGLEPQELPEPYRDLLVHTGDMTSRLEDFYHCRIHLRVLCNNVTDRSYYREVVLMGGELPIEYGAIDINMPEFDDQVRERILLGNQPLGGLLNEFDIEYASRPRAFIKVAPDKAIASALGLEEPVDLYGRSNELIGLAGETLARIVEILRPTQAHHA